jgi:hypothetical protein
LNTILPDAYGSLAPSLGPPPANHLAGRVAGHKILFPVSGKAADDLDVANQAFATAGDYGLFAWANACLAHANYGRTAL